MTWHLTNGHGADAISNDYISVRTPSDEREILLILVCTSPVKGGHVSPINKAPNDSGNLVSIKAMKPESPIDTSQQR